MESSLTRSAFYLNLRSIFKAVDEPGKGRLEKPYSGGDGHSETLIAMRKRQSVYWPRLFQREVLGEGAFTDRSITTSSAPRMRKIA